MDQQIIQAGNSLAVTIPKQIAQKLGWKKGQKIFLTEDDTSKTVTVSDNPPASDGLTPEYFKWKKDFLKKNAALLTRLAEAHGK